MNTKLHLYRKLGSMLESKAVYFKRHAFKVKYRKITKRELEGALEKFGIPDEKVHCADSPYWLTDVNTIKLINKYDGIDKGKYMSNYRDCDNFADLYSARMAWIFKLNSCGTAEGVELKDRNGNRIGYHRLNLIVSLKDEIIKAYLYEPQTDALDEVTDYQEEIWQTGRYNELDRFKFN